MNRIHDLLEEDPLDARERRSRTFDRLAGELRHRVVIYGAGALGRRLARALSVQGAAPLAFADRRAAALGGRLDDVAVVTPEEAVERFGSSAVFVVAIWNTIREHRYPQVRRELEQMGARCVVPALALMWKHAEALLPYYSMDVPERTLAAADDLRRLADDLADAPSQSVLEGILRWRLWLEFDGLPEPAPGLQYFQPDLVPLFDDEVFVDCGAFDGDTLWDFIRLTQGTRARAIAIEPDPVSCSKLRERLESLPSSDRDRVRVLQLAVGRRREVLRFEASGSIEARVSAEGSIEVESAPLDEILADERPTFVKMDLEGWELEALEGCEQTLRRASPAAAICLYHRPEDLWRLPLVLREALPSHALHLRAHSYETWELVCYAVEPGRRAR